MPFNSYPYLIFIVLVVAVYLLLERFYPRGKRCFLLFVSYVFYAWWRADFLALLIGSTLMNYGLGHAITRRVEQKRGTRALLVLGLVFNLGLIAVFKYAALFVGTADTLFGMGYPIPQIFLPLAISFFTFEQISYLVDAARAQAPRYSLLDYALFVSFFPHLIAGPIIQHDDLIPQFRQSRTPTTRNDDLALGVSLFALGLAKKTLIADNLGTFADAVFNQAYAGVHLGVGDSWLGTLFFTFQIYFDFSAYSDIALASACLLGIRLPINFHSPYKAASIIEFWRRWRISLSNFLRNYLYIALGGNRHGRVRRYINLMLTMLLGGLWHGANWTFMLWGGLHGTYLVINHGWHAIEHRVGVRLPAALSRPLSVLLTFAATVFAWVIFRAPDMATAGRVLRGLAGAGGQSHIVTFGPLAAVALISLFAIIWFAPNSMEIMWRYRPALPPPRGAQQVEPARWLAWRPSAMNAIVYGLIFIAAMMALSDLSPFIYFQF